MTPQAYLYICDGDIDSPVLTHTKMDWPEKYPHWQEIPLVMAQRQWVGLTDEEIEACHDEIRTRLMNTYNTKDIYRVIEAKLKEKNNG